MFLTNAGIPFMVAAPDIDETPRERERPVQYVERLAREKAAAVAGATVLAADTTVDCDGVILGKPVDEAEARSMLRLLSGRSHYVHTGVAVRHGGETASLAVTTEVIFVRLTDQDIEWYIATGEPTDKAGAYALQGGAARFVSAINGSVSAVVGLPMAETVGLLRALHVID